MAARESVIVLIAESSVVRAAWEPAAVVRSIDETPAPAVVTTVAEPSVKPAAVKAAAVLPETLMPALAVVDSVTNERLVTVLLAVEDVRVPLIPVSTVVFPVSVIPPVDVRATEPAVLTAVTPVWADAALIALAKLSNFVEIPISVAFVPAVEDVATTVPAVFVPVEKPAVKLPEYVPSAALAVLVVVAEAAVIPDVKLAKAAPT